MNWKKLAPWNWFKKEEEETSVPVRASDDPLAPLSGQLFNDFHREMNRLFETFMRNFSPGFNQLGRSFRAGSGLLRPSLDLSASEKEYNVSVELPGVEPEEIKLQVQKDNLLITGEKKQENEIKEDNYYRIERSYGSFRRVLTLPEDSDKDNISATFKNGVMHISIPRKELPGSDVRQIEVKTG